MRRLFTVTRTFLVIAAIASLVLLGAPNPVVGAAGPTLIRDINQGGSANPSSLTRVGNVVFFVADDGVHGTELWTSDGAATGTRLVRDIRQGGVGSAPDNLVAVGAWLFFTATDGVHGRELWKSDGTRAGTVMVKDINTHGPNSYCGNGIYMPYAPLAVGSRVFFFLHCGGVWSPVLYVSDGTAAGTHFVNAPYASYREDAEGTHPVADVLGKKLYFVARVSTCDPQGDNCLDVDQLWVSNGTDPGTHRMAGSPTADQITFLPAHGQSLYFTTTNQPDPFGAIEVRLWKTNGTASGTKPLTAVGELTGAPTEAVYMAKRLYFSSGPDGGLWRTNGTSAGTKTVMTRPASFLATAGERLYFSAYVFWTGTYLWESDGTAAGTNPVTGFGDLAPTNLVAVGDEVCFYVQDWNAGTWQVWESDGTLAGTNSVKTFVNPQGTDEPGLAVGNTLYFAADDGTHGVELWSYTP